MVAPSEKLLPGPAAVEAVTGERPHYSTFFRWTQRGVMATSGSRSKLDFVKAGSKRLTSEAAVRRFFEAATAAANGEPLSENSRTNRQKAAAIRRAEKELEEAGF